MTQLCFDTHFSPSNQFTGVSLARDADDNMDVKCLSKKNRNRIASKIAFAFQHFPFCKAVIVFKNWWKGSATVRGIEVSDRKWNFTWSYNSSLRWKNGFMRVVAVPTLKCLPCTMTVSMNTVERKRTMMSQDDPKLACCFLFVCTDILSFHGSRTHRSNLKDRDGAPHLILETSQSAFGREESRRCLS